MTAPSSSSHLDTAADPPEPANRAARRAARRGKGGDHPVPEQARYQPSAHARPAQGRRINPVRRTG